MMMYRRSLGRECCVENLEQRRLLATYYVATTGSNTAAGTSAAPWATLQHAADRVTAGDTVIVLAGNYVGFDLRTNGTAAARITFRGETGATIDRVNTRTNRDGINLERASYITIEGFTLIGTNNATTSRAGIRIVGDGDDNGVFSTGVIIRNNRADRWGYWGILTGFTDDILIQGNECSRSVQEHGIYCSNSGDRPTIRGNEVWGNRANGIHMNGDIFTGNTSLPRVDGIISGAVVERNIIYGNGVGGGSGINCDGVQNSIIRNNLLYDNHASGIALYRIDGGGASTGNTVVNNTIIHAADARWCVRIADASINNTLFNNIFFNLNSNRGAYDLDSDCLPGLKSERNLIEGQFAIDGSFINLSQWRTQTNNDTTSTAITQTAMQALFTNYGAQDFSLATGSSALNAGIASFNGQPAPTIDLLASPRPAGGGFDVGAYEQLSRNLDPRFELLPANDLPPTAARTVALSVLAEDDGGEINLRYSWSIISKPDGAPSPLYSSNQTNASKDVTIRFRASGAYTFSVAAIDQHGGSAAAPVSLTITQKLTQIVVSPNPRNLLRGQSQRFVATAVDQFTRPMYAQPAFTWSKTGIGRVNANGRFYAPEDVVGFATVRATANGLRGSASITVL
jgi:hypothetical protein